MGDPNASRSSATELFCLLISVRLQLLDEKFDAIEFDALDSMRSRIKSVMRLLCFVVLHGVGIVQHSCISIPGNFVCKHKRCAQRLALPLGLLRLNPNLVVSTGHR